MPFRNDLNDIFNATVSGYGGTINEIYLFRTLAHSVHEAASRNGFSASVLQTHASKINFEEKSGVDFYYANDSKKCVCCELADIMFIVYNNHEARLCFMQNKYDRRSCRSWDFKADTRQLYVLKNRTPYWKGRKHPATMPPENILCDARYSSITNYGVFACDSSGQYIMEYYIAEAIHAPTGRGRKCVVKFPDTYDELSTIDTTEDQLNYAKNLLDFGQGLENMKIGQKYDTLDSLLQAINIETVINHFRDIGATSIVYDSGRSSALAKVAVIVDFGQERIG